MGRVDLLESVLKCLTLVVLRNVQTSLDELLKLVQSLSFVLINRHFVDFCLSFLDFLFVIFGGHLIVVAFLPREIRGQFHLRAGVSGLQNGLIAHVPV